MGTKNYPNAFTAIDKRRLNDVRKLRRSAWSAEMLDPVDRAVLGLTGSVKELDKYRELAGTIGKLAGQPLIVISRIDEKRRVSAASGGIINGDLFVQGSSFDIDNTPGDASGHVMLAVPVSQFVTGNDVIGGVRPPTNPPTEENLTVAYLICHERDNRTSDPERDFYDHMGGDYSLLLGRAAIYKSEYFQQGLSKVLLAMESPAIPVSAS